MKKQIISDKKRWEKFRIANSKFPHVRRIEFTKQLEKTSPQNGEIILEIGTGSGYLTFELAGKVGKSGKIITYDYHKQNLDFVNRVNRERFPIVTVHQSSDYSIKLPDESIDKVSTIASLHHYDNRSRNSGIRGRQKIIGELYRVLRKGGKLIISDIADGTPPQRYFDEAIDNPECPAYCHPHGHPHDFLNEKIIKDLCKKAGFDVVSFAIESTPWLFDNEQQAKAFLHTLHNARCSHDESLNVAKKYLSYAEINGKFRLGWQLFYLVAYK